jgi:hypothetical protein
MIVVSAIVQLADSNAGAAALDELRADPRIEIGALRDRRVAVCAVSPTRGEDKRLWQTLQDRPGVSFIDFVFAAFDPPDDAD